MARAGAMRAEAKVALRAFQAAPDVLTVYGKAISGGAQHAFRGLLNTEPASNVTPMHGAAA
ncbi:MAG: hypothetical protein KGS28_14515 [Betaproteobacteria bacterium]|nr:hypothetical protein [Betaproteobacteria bacterium]